MQTLKICQKVLGGLGVAIISTKTKVYLQKKLVHERRWRGISICMVVL